MLDFDYILTDIVFRFATLPIFYLKIKFKKGMAEQALKIPLSKVVFCDKTAQNLALIISFLKSSSKMGSDVGFESIF